MIYIIDHKDSFTHNIVNQFSKFYKRSVFLIVEIKNILRLIFGFRIYVCLCCMFCLFSLVFGCVFQDFEAISKLCIETVCQSIVDIRLPWIPNTRSEGRGTWFRSV